MPSRSRSKKAPAPQGAVHVEAQHITVNQTGVAVRVIDRQEREPEEGDLDAVATILAHAIDRPGIAGRVLGGTVKVLANLPSWLSPLNGLLGITIRNGLDILEAMPRLPAAPRILRLKRAEEREGAGKIVQRIQIK